MAQNGENIMTGSEVITLCRHARKAGAINDAFLTTRSQHSYTQTSTHTEYGACNSWWCAHTLIVAVKIPRFL
jgi:hypothetical protein